MNNTQSKLTRITLRTRQLAFCFAAMASVSAPAAAQLNTIASTLLDYASSNTAPLKEHNVAVLTAADLTLVENTAVVGMGSVATFEVNGRTINITISETNGLTVSDNKNLLATQKGHFVDAGSYLAVDESGHTNNAYIHTLVFDINSQQIRSYRIGTENSQNHTVSITQTSATEVKDSEALCSANIGGKLQFINIDALGMLTQYLALPDKSDSTHTVYHLRTLAIGPGIKSCALGVSYGADQEGAAQRDKRHVEQTIYLADEYAGVWAMPANAEAEVERSLIFNQADTPVEGVATLNGLDAHTLIMGKPASENPVLQGQVTAWVSPEHKGMWLHNTCATTFFGFDVNIAPEDIALSVKSDTVYANIYDDNSGSTFTTDITQAIARLNTCHESAPSLDKRTLNKTPIVINENLTIETPITNDDVPTNKTPMLSTIELQPIYETDVVENYGDAADDPAIWVNKSHPSKSLVIGTNKKGSLNTYNLEGELVASHKVGRVNNVGVAYDWAPEHDIAVASNRSSNSMSVFFIDKKTGELTFNTNLPTPLTDIYGLCVFTTNNHTQVLVNSTDGRYLRYQLNPLTDVNSKASAKTNSKANRDTHDIIASKTDRASPSLVSATLILDFHLPSQPEGCVVDTDTQIAYLGEESAGIWALDVSEVKAKSSSMLNKTINQTPTLIIPIEAPVTADIEGLSLFDVDGVRYLIASSQGNNQYAVYESKAPYRLMGMVSIGANYDNGIDGVSETDGLETTNVNLGGLFKNGLFVVQDGRNVMPSQRQNFKLVAGDDVAGAIRTFVITRTR